MHSRVVIALELLTIRFVEELFQRIVTKQLIAVGRFFPSWNCSRFCPSPNRTLRKTEHHHWMAVAFNHALELCLVV